jgi:hypothetical protein
MRGVWVALMAGAVVTLSLGPADAKCGRRGECGHRVRVIHVTHVVHVARADNTGTEMGAMAVSQIEMAKKQLDMADAAVTPSEARAGHGQ